MNTIAFEELKFVAPRVALYCGIAYVAVRAIRTAIDKVSVLMGAEEPKRCC